MNKKSIFLIAILCILFAFNSNAQARLGGGLAYGSEVKSGGISLNGEFFLKNKLAVAPGFIFYFEDFWEANANVNFMLSGNDAVLPYAIGGLNLFSSNGNSELGLNAGIGANFDIGWRARLFGETKYVLGEADQLVLLGGVKFPIN
ncbi:MAG: hypothetical protein HRT61_08090 [Ekhidna sp.]|nr:hypothetical protein [Ekhidna sp.]